MMRDSDGILHELEHRERETLSRTREMLYQEGRPDLVTELDAKIRDIRLGVDGAQRTWHSISETQRRVMRILGEGRYLVRAAMRKNRYDAECVRGVLGIPNVPNVCGVATVRNLCSRELLHVDGGAFDPEAKIVLTERGRFVTKHGPTS